jgi:hypothetical protein
MRESGASQHAIERFLKADRVHPATRARLERAVEKLERLVSAPEPTHPRNLRGREKDTNCS